MMANDKIINIEIKLMKNATSSLVYSGYGISCVAGTFKKSKESKSRRTDEKTLVGTHC